MPTVLHSRHVREKASQEIRSPVHCVCVCVCVCAPDTLDRYVCDCAPYIKCVSHFNESVCLCVHAQYVPSRMFTIAYFFHFPSFFLFLFIPNTNMVFII